MAIVYLYCDESGKYKKDAVVTLAGVAASKTGVEKFENEWATLLRHYELRELHMSHVADLKQKVGRLMPSGQTIDQRTDALVAFADCINRHLELGLVQAWDVNGYNSLSLEVKKELGGSHDPHQLAFSYGLMEVVKHIQDEDRIHVIADDSQTAWDTYMHYKRIKDAEPQVMRKLVGLTFADSAYFSPLQAADMVAFLARRQAREEFFGQANQFKRLHDYLTTDPNRSFGLMRWFKLYVTEEKQVELANAIIDAREEEKQRIRELRHGNARTAEGSAQPDQGENGSREAGT